jgi:hypothetical protein
LPFCGKISAGNAVAWRLILSYPPSTAIFTLFFGEIDTVKPAGRWHTDAVWDPRFLQRNALISQNDLLIVKQTAGLLLSVTGPLLGGSDVSSAMFGFAAANTGPQQHSHTRQMARLELR